MNRFDIETEFRKLQDYICGEVELLDGKSKFNEDAWKRDEGGGGYTRTISEGILLKKEV